MNDQAAVLRAMMAGASRPAAPRSPVPTWVVGSGKGGVGKSVLAVLLASALARRGRRVLLHDATHNQGDLPVLLGVRPPATLESLLAGDVGAQELLLPVSDGMTLLPGASGAELLYTMGAVDRARLLFRLTGLYHGFDAVVVDAGPGIDGVVRVAAAGATRLLAVTTPEPAALTDTYALIKLVDGHAPGLPVDVVVNRVASAEEGNDSFAKLHLAVARFLRREVDGPVMVPDDPAIRDATRRPGTLAGLAVDAVSRFAARLDASLPAEEACPR